jgi:hypothetical protein
MFDQKLEVVMGRGGSFCDLRVRLRQVDCYFKGCPCYTVSSRPTGLHGETLLNKTKQAEKEGGVTAGLWRIFC